MRGRPSAEALILADGVWGHRKRAGREAPEHWTGPQILLRIAERAELALDVVAVDEPRGVSGGERAGGRLGGRVRALPACAGVVRLLEHGARGGHARGVGGGAVGRLARVGDQVVEQGPLLRRDELALPRAHRFAADQIGAHDRALEVAAAISPEKLRPWTSGRPGTPASSSSVGARSTSPTCSSTTRPGGTRPAARTTSGTRSASSWRSKPWVVQKCSPNPSPWSEVTTRMVCGPSAPRKSTSRSSV